MINELIEAFLGLFSKREFLERLKTAEIIKHAICNFSFNQSADPQEIINLSFKTARTIFVINIVSNAYANTKFLVSINGKKEKEYAGRVINIYPSESQIYNLRVRVYDEYNTIYGTITLIYTGTDIKLENKIEGGNYLSELQELLEKAKSQINYLSDIKTNTNPNALIYLSLYDDENNIKAIDKLKDIDSSLSSVKTAVDNVKTATDNVKSSVDNVKSSVDSVKGSIDNMYSTTNILDKLSQLDNIKSNTDNLDTSLSTVKTAIDNVKSSADNVKSSVDNMYSVNNILDNLQKLDKNISDLYNKLNDIYNKIDDTLNRLGWGYDYANNVNRKIKVNANGEIVVALP